GDEDVAGIVAGVAAVAAEAERSFAGQAPQLRGNERGVGGGDDDDRAYIFSVGGVLGDFLADGNARDAQLVALSVVALHEHADRVAARFRVEHARRGSYSSLEFVADHAGAAAYVAFFYGAGVRGIQGVEDVLGFHVESVDVVEIAVPGFGHHGQGPPVAFHVGLAALHFPGDDGVANQADAVRVGDHDGAVEEAGVFEPGSAGHLSVAVEGEPGAEDGVVRVPAPRMDGGDAGGDRAFTDFELAAAGDERGVSDFNAVDVGDGVVRPGSTVEGDAEVAGTGLGLGQGESAGTEKSTENSEDKCGQERECARWD